MTLAPIQYDVLSRPLNPARVRQLKGMSHVEAWDVRRYLIRIFGFGGYDTETIKCECIERIEIPADGPKGRPRYTIVYRAEVRLIVKNPDGTVFARYEDGATGDAVNQPSLGDAHDFAMKTAMSQALKRCAVNLGDQFGLSLYNDGSPGPVVGRPIVPTVEGATETPEPAELSPVEGGELVDEQPNTQQEQEPQEERQAPPQRPAIPAPRTPVDAQQEQPPGPDLRPWIGAAVQEPNPARMRVATLKAGQAGLLGIDVAGIILPQHAAVLKLNTSAPVPLEAFLEAVRVHLEASNGRSVVASMEQGQEVAA